MKSHTHTQTNCTTTVQAQRLATEEGALRSTSEQCEVAIEAPVTVQVVDRESYTTMCTPADLRALAVGLLFSEGLIDSVDDVGVLMHCPDDPNVIRAHLKQTPTETCRRSEHRLILSSCGLCGSESIEERLVALPPVASSLRIPAARLRKAVEAMRARQSVFPRTGGTHAAAILDGNGHVVSFAEDVGRHNALDKAIGKCLLERRAPTRHIAALSGRVSLEMVAKCARAGVQVIAAVSAPTSLAVQAAEASGITLAGFVRGERATVFTAPQRIEQDARRVSAPE